MVELKLGDIIQIKSPSNEKYHNKYFVTEYINDEAIKLANLDNGEQETLEFHENRLIDSTITQFMLLSRSEESGYARQHGLLPDTDIEIKFADSIDAIRGKITDLEEDMITVVSNEDGKRLYIDFEYKGLPETIMEITRKELDKDSDKSKEEEEAKEENKGEKENKGEEVKEEESKEEESKEDASMEFTSDGNIIINLPKNPTIDNKLDADFTYTEQESTKLETNHIEPQLQDLFDKLLKNKHGKSDTHTLVSRFKELREKFSTFDKNGNITGFHDFNESYKPLVDHLDRLDKNSSWIIPVVSNNTDSSIKTGTALADLNVIEDNVHKRYPLGETVSIKSVVILNNKMKNAPMVENLLENVSTDYVYEEDAFQSNMTFAIPSNLKADYKSVLQSVIPGGVSLINENHVGYSLNQMLRFYEPFLLDTDTITCESEFYKEIKKRIQTNIKTYIEEYASGKRDITTVDNEGILYNNIVLENIKSELLDKIKKGYGLQDGLSSSETLNIIHRTDNGAFYMSIMSYLMAYLYTPELEKLTAIEHHTSERRRVIVKKYTSMDALQKDNGRDEVYYDKEFDKTPYEILKKYTESQKTMKSDEFLDYLTLVLKTEHNIENPETIAKTIVQKKKPIEEGNYAVLEIHPKLKTAFDEDLDKDKVAIETDIKKRVSYYIRKGDNWVRDEDADAYFCDDVICEKKPSDRMKEIAKRTLHATETMKDFEDKMAKMGVSKEKHLLNLGRLQKHTDELYSLRAYNLGMKYIEHEVALSPYAKLRDSVLAGCDSYKKQEYIIRFKLQYCREAVSEESIHWYYCKETNVKLLPTFLYKLAMAMHTQCDYEEIMKNIISTRGIKCDGIIVDKHSGFMIRKEEGDKEEEEGEKEEEEEEKEEALSFTKGTDQYIIYLVAESLCDRFEVDFHKLVNKIISHTTWLVKEYITEIKYYSNLKETSKTTFQVWKTRNILLFTAAVTFVVIQTNTMSTPIRRNGPCKYSLTGYPLEESADQSGLKLLSCILNDLKHNLGEPWTHVKKYKTDKFLREIHAVIKNILVHNYKIKQMLENKRILLNVVSDYVPRNHWPLFQPPAPDPSPLKKSIQSNISPAFKSEIADSIKTASKSQHKYLGTMYAKIIENSYMYLQERNEHCLDFVKTYGQVYNEIKQLSVPPFVFSKTHKTELLADSTSTFSDNNIYSAYLHYCKLQCEQPIPDDLTTVCQEKMLGLDTMRLEEAIKALEDNGKKQTVHTLSELMCKIAQRNIVHIHEEEFPLSFTDMELSDKQDLVIKHILNALANKDKIEDLDNYLKRLNTKMIDNICEYLKRYGREIPKTRLLNHFNNLQNVENLAIFVKNAMYNITMAMRCCETLNVRTLFDEIRKDPVIKDMQFLINQIGTVSKLDLKNIYKYCYVSVFSQIISESQEDKYVQYRFEEMFKENDIDVTTVVEERDTFYNDICNCIRQIVDKDIEHVEFMNQKYKGNCRSLLIPCLGRILKKPYGSLL
jgi:hypothetical protein